MSNINLLIANASHSLSDQNILNITNGFDRAVTKAGEVLSLSNVDVICINDSFQVIPETGMSGYTPNRNLVYLYVDSGVEISEDETFYTLMHEFSHAKRYEKQGYGETLFDSMIFEGIGVALEDEESSGQGSFLSNYIKDKDNRALFEKVASSFDEHDFDRFYWFIQESDDMPRWTGYRVGYYIVTEFMKKTNKKASELVLEDFDSFRKFVSDGLGRA